MAAKLIEGFKNFGVSVLGVQKQILTDEAGRTKISHAQPAAVVGTITANAQTVSITMDSLSDVIFYFWGAAHAGINLTFEQSPDSTNGTNGNWFPVIAKNQGSSTLAAGTATGALTTNSSTSWAVSAPGAAYVRVRATAYTSGTLTVSASGSTAARPTDVSALITNGSINVQLGAAATAIAKAEDAVHATGDVGVPPLGVRVPATPVAQTSAAGDYGNVAITSDGKQVIAGQGAEEHSWQGYVGTLTTTAAAIKTAAGAGVRNYITDVIVENWGAAVARVEILDGSTIIATVQVGAMATLPMQFKTPLKSTANAALNVRIQATASVAVAASGYVGV